MGSVHDDFTDISDALVAAHSINELSVTWCYFRLVRLKFGLDFVQDDVTDISDALVAAQSITNDSVIWC